MTDRTRAEDPLAAERWLLRLRQGGGARYDSPRAPAADLADARLGTAYFARKLSELPDAALWAPSARARWTRRRVIAAVALQAREIAHLLEDVVGLSATERPPTDAAAIDLAETLPAGALRHLATHADIHLNVVWRDLTDEQWDLPIPLAGGAGLARETPWMRALELWSGALALNNGARPTDVPAKLRQHIALAQ